MFEFTEDERAHLTEMRAITKDSQGREVLVGLTLDETVIYMAYHRKIRTGEHDSEGGEVYLELHNKHERARLAVIGAEHILRTENPSRH
jgi:hypothetical protein